MKAHIKTPLAYLFKNQGIYIWTTLVILILVTFIVVSTQLYEPWEISLEDWYGNIFDPIFGVAMVLIAFGIWFFENKQEWEESLPKKLTVLFLYKGTPAYFAYRTTLFDESDARPLALSIGGQMIGSSFIPYSPFMYPETNIDKKDKFKDLTVVFNIIKAPTKPGPGKIEIKPKEGDIMIWTEKGQTIYSKSDPKNSIPIPHEVLIERLSKAYKNKLGNKYQYPSPKQS